MQQIRFGRTGLMVSRTGFGCIPIQRLSFAESDALLRRAFDAGVNFYDTARSYSDSERRIGQALGQWRERVVIATKTPSRDRAGIFADIETSLKELDTDRVDLYQFHNPPHVPAPGDEMYDAMLDLKKQGKIRFVGFTNHDLSLAVAAARSGHYDAVQYPLSPLSGEAELDLVRWCLEGDVGLLAMKAMAGGLIGDAAISWVFLRRFAGVVPIWGMQKMAELEEFIGYENAPPPLTPELLERLDKVRKELSGSFCRACGYCMPCPAGIPIPTAARMSLLLSRAVAENFLTPEWREKMDNIKNCVHCGQCKKRCPYRLDTPSLLAEERRRYLARG